jgi:toxin secretion/phage lysis holin
LTWFKGAVAIISTVITFLLGSWDISLVVLAGFLLIDFMTGCICAIKDKKLSSSAGFKGIAKKVIIILILILSVLLDRLINEGTWIFRTLVTYFYIANEGLSILENAARLGVPIPEKVRDVLLQLKEGKK